jgi:guanylate kinase
MLLERRLYVFATTVSHTTRCPRPGGKGGKSYCFVSVSHFRFLISQNAYLEYTIFNGNYYGTSRRTVTAQAEKGAQVLLGIEMEGIKPMHADSGIRARYIFMRSPNLVYSKLVSGPVARKSKQMFEGGWTGLKGRLSMPTAQALMTKQLSNDELEKGYIELEEFIFSL